MMIDGNDEISFEAENYRGTKDFSYKTIVLSQVQKCVTNASKEFRAGFFIYSQNAGQTPQKLRYIGDSKEEYYNSLNVLYDLLIAKFDDDMKEQGKTLYEELEEIKAKRTELIKTDLDTAKKSQKEHETLKLSVYRKLFQQLCLFLDRQGWLEMEVIDD